MLPWLLGEFDLIVGQIVDLLRIWNDFSILFVSQRVV